MAVQLVEALSTPASGVTEARLLVRQGRIRAAAAAVRALREPAQQALLDDAEKAIALALDVEIQMAYGDLGAAIAAGELLEPLTALPGLAGAVAHYSQADVAAALGEHELALERFLAAGQADDSAFPPWRAGAALALVRLGRRREALDLAREHHRLVAHASPFDVATALRTLATADPDGQRVPRLRGARALLDGTDLDRLRAQIDTDLAGLLVLDGDVTEAVALLRGAEAYAGREDLWPLQSRIRRLLDRLGEAPHRMEAEALAILTVGERRVTLLVLDGLTNREIAERLLVSVKAVEGHLSKVYRKLGVASRSALTASLRAPA